MCVRYCRYILRTVVFSITTVIRQHIITSSFGALSLAQYLAGIFHTEDLVKQIGPTLHEVTY